MTHSCRRSVCLGGVANVVVVVVVVGVSVAVSFDALLEGSIFVEIFFLFRKHNVWQCYHFKVLKSGWEFTKLLTQIHNIFRNFKVLLESSYL